MTVIVITSAKAYAHDPISFIYSSSHAVLLELSISILALNALPLALNFIFFKNKNEIEVIKSITSNIHLISVDTDYFFTANEIKTAFQEVKNYKNNTFYHEIKSIHGHDAFLIEFEQLNTILKPIFN